MATSEGRSVNAVVREILRQAVPPSEPRADLRALIRAAGLEVTLPRTGTPALPRDEAIELTRGWGRLVSEALEADRNHR
ncbi:MAG: toxin-antitoxin system HicB family antitoxin [Chloroflexi bacterium]|nr:toxin-antitoxin system HicB family antitoxin [Chloroflexota bacterium]